LQEAGAEFATVESCVAAIMRISCDKEINGEDSSLDAWKPEKQNCLLMLTTGHSFAIVPYSVAEVGFKDVEEDDWTDENYWLQQFQRTVIKARGDAWN
jgi:hypothetical protein